MIHFNNLTLGYNKHPIVHHLNAHIPPGDSVAVIGPNGGGKSISVPKNKIAYLPQISSIDHNFPISTYELIALGLWHKKGWFKKYTKNDHMAIKSAIEQVELQGMAQQPLCALSGGQIQRALFARLILQDANLILLDEPFNAIDYKTNEALLNIINLWKRQNRTIITVLHNYSQVKSYFDKTLIIAREIIEFDKTEKVLTQENLNKAFSISLSPDENANVCNR